jgi:hypothetical protein
VVSRVSAPDKPRLFVQEDPKHTCQVTYSSDVTGSHLQVSYSSDRVSTLRVNVSQIDTKVRHPDPDPWMTTPGIVEAPDAPTQLENWTLEFMKRDNSASLIETWNPPPTRSTPTGYEGRLTFVKVSYRISELFCRQVCASFSMN